MQRIAKLLFTPEPQFLLPGLGAIAIGSCAGIKAGSDMNLSLAVLAAAAMVFLNAGANMLNDYFDHLSGNDWLNQNQTKFGGGSRYIQTGVITPEAMRAAGAIAASIGVLLGLVIVAFTGSVFILLLGIVGFLGGVLWTMPPVKVCYRFIGEPYIFLMFGLLPTFGAYYLQHNEINFIPLYPAIIIGIHISLVALINSIPDREGDAAADKKTFTVRFGVRNAVYLYRAMLAFAYALSLAAALFLGGISRGAAIGHLLTLPLAIVCVILATPKRLSEPNVNLPNAMTIFLYCASAAIICVGIMIC